MAILIVIVFIVIVRIVIVPTVIVLITIVDIAIVLMVIVLIAILPGPPRPPLGPPGPPPGPLGPSPNLEDQEEKKEGTHQGATQEGKDLSSSFANVYNWLCCTSVRDQPILAAIMNEYFDGEHLSPVKLTSVIEPLSLRRSSSGSRFQVMSAISAIFGNLADFFVMCLLFPFKR